MVQRVASPQHYSPPTARELRAQSVHRLQIGVLGVALMVLLVALASVINDRVRLSDSLGGKAAAPVASKSNGSSDPLADIGVMPSAAPSATMTAAPRH